MANWLLGHAGPAYVVALVGGFLAVAVWETLQPLRQPTVPLVPRWIVNIGLLAINQSLLHLVLPVVAIGAAWYAQERSWGLLPLLGLPSIVSAVIGLIALDLLRWAVHAAMHRVPLLWRVHRVHHSDLDYDCTIGLRFHPVEALLTSLAIVAGVVVLGVSPIVVLISDVSTIAHGYVAHGNVSLSARWDRIVRKLLVTPDLHRVHHSTRADESLSNFGSVLSCWDRLFGSYCAAPADGQLDMTIGLDTVRDPQRLTLARVLWLPLARS